TGLYNISIFDKDWEKIKAKNTGMKCAICYIRMEQYDLFEASSGLIGADKIVETYARVASNVLGQYGKLYIANKKDFILFVSNEQLRTKFLTDLMELTTKLLDTFAIDGRLYRPESRIGVILTDNCNDSITSEKILYIAKKALKIAYKNTINNLYVLRAPQFNNEMIDFSRESAVTTMISNNELEVYFQPQVNIKTNKIYGFEALTRIVGASAGEITIEELINNAHQYGGILELGEFVLHKAMQFAKSIQEYDIHISVNVSPLQIMQKGFAHSVLNMIKKYQVNPRNISIEIVENAALYNNGELFKKIQTLREGGVSVHMDDFGIAYSSLLRLKTLPIDTIKIDKSFVDDILTDAISASLVKNIIMIARDLKLECICEGVESKEQCKMVEKLGCYIIQGYLYSKAIDAEHAKELLKEKNANV
ncbi:MAG: EAL domain-containing protein, partial [Clostridia bacterium]